MNIGCLRKISFGRAIHLNKYVDKKMVTPDLLLPLRMFLPPLGPAWIVCYVMGSIISLAVCMTSRGMPKQYTVSSCILNQSNFFPCMSGVRVLTVPHHPLLSAEVQKRHKITYENQYTNISLVITVIFLIVPVFLMTKLN
jgi:hypothetical protein